jgi:hypothetical protein
VHSFFGSITSLIAISSHFMIRLRRISPQKQENTKGIKIIFVFSKFRAFVINLSFLALACPDQVYFSRGASRPKSGLFDPVTSTL